MSPKVQSILESLPLSRTEFVARYGENVLKGMTLADAVRQLGAGEIVRTRFGDERLNAQRAAQAKE